MAKARPRTVKGITHEQRYLLCLQKQRYPGMKQAELATWFENKFAIPISQPTISHSLKQSATILSQGLDTPGIETKRVRKRPVRHPELEQRIFEWAKTQQQAIDQHEAWLKCVPGRISPKDQVEPITGPAIIREARRIAKEMNAVSTVFSSAWLSRFKARYRIRPDPTSQHHPQHLCIVPLPHSSPSEVSLESRQVSFLSLQTNTTEVLHNNLRSPPQDNPLRAFPSHSDHSWVQRKPKEHPQQPPQDLDLVQQQGILCSSTVVSLKPSTFQIPVSAERLHYHSSIPIAAFPLEDSTFKPIVDICPSPTLPSQLVCGQPPLISQLSSQGSIGSGNNPSQEHTAVLIPSDSVDVDSTMLEQDPPPRDIQEAHRLVSHLRLYVATYLADPSKANQSLDILEREIGSLSHHK